MNRHQYDEIMGYICAIDSQTKNLIQSLAQIIIDDDRNSIQIIDCMILSKGILGLLHETHGLIEDKG